MTYTANIMDDETATPQQRLAEALLALVVPRLDITAAAVASQLVDSVCADLDTERIETRIADGINAADIAQYVEISEIAAALDAEEIAQYVEISEIADGINAAEIAQYVEISEIADALDLDDISARVLAALQVPALDGSDGSDLIDDLADLDAERTSLLDVEERLVQAEARIEALTGALRTSVECIARAIEALS